MQPRHTLYFQIERFTRSSGGLLNTVQAQTNAYLWFCFGCEFRFNRGLPPIFTNNISPI